MNVTRYKCSVLAVDDEPAVLAILAAQLGTDFEVVTATTADRARAILAQRSVDVVLSDLQLPDESGLDLLDWVRRTVPHTARVLLTGTARMQDAVDAINHSQVHRLVLKPWRSEDLLQTLRTVARGLLLERSHEQLLDELRRLNLELEQRVHTRTLELEQVMLQLEQKNHLLQKMAATDPLTGLANRRALERGFQRACAESRRDGLPLLLALVDLDQFKQINDTHGHGTGDAFLVYMARRLVSALRPEDLVARTGGDEFVALVRSQETAPTFQSRLADASRGHFIGGGIELDYAGASVGVAHADVEAAKLDAMLAEADREMYEVKRQRRGGVQCLVRLAV